MKHILLWLLMVLLLLGKLGAQTCTVIGQTPSTAFPVCGTDTFSQQTVPICANHQVKTFCNDNVVYWDQNPFWYRFTCFQTGTLGFSVVPFNLNDDYDWILYDITNRNAADVYDSTNFIVTYNWSGNTSLESARGYTGVTGTSPSGTQTYACATNPQELGGNPPFTDASTINKMPKIYQGHTYLLMVSHYTLSQSGYKLFFNGGTAIITDSKKPQLLSAFPSCDATKITVLFNKGMQCSSLAGDGSDFTIPSAPGVISGASGTQCTTGFDFDTMVVSLKSPLPPGNYQLTAQIGSDGNTVLDDCSNALPVGSNISFSIVPPAPTPMDSLTPVTCAPSVLQLVFKKPIQCSSVASDGSDFKVSGPTAVSVVSASGTCVGGVSTTIDVQLSSPIVQGGSYQITLVQGTDGNTLIDACGQQTPALSSLSFSTKDTVSAQFSYQILFGCKADTVVYSYNPAGGVNYWVWNLDSQVVNPSLAPSVVYTSFGAKQVQHIVSNGFCSDTANVVVSLNNALKAGITGPEEICPKDPVSFQDSSTGQIVSWNWEFGDGTGSDLQNPPPHQYPNTATEETYTVSLQVENNLGCYDTISKALVKLQSCYITVPNAFTPNGDGKNDYLYPLNAFKARNLLFRVFNRYGQLVFETRDWTKKWDGTINGKPQDTGVYVWMLQYTDGDSGKSFFLKGTSVLIR